MDQRQKSALRKNHITLADQLILDEDFFAQLRQSKIFSEGMISIIKAENKPRNQVYKMLELLEKRGPHAFENFVGILRENFYWVADQLEETYQERLKASHTDKKGCQPVQHNYDQTNRTKYERRAVSTPPRPRPQRAVPFPVQISSSTSHYPISTTDTITERQNNWDYQSPNDSSGDEVDGPNIELNGQVNCEATAVPNKKELEENVHEEKNYVDKSLSPIHILESRPTVKNFSHALCSPILAPEDDNSEVEIDPENTGQFVADGGKDDDNDSPKPDDQVDGSGIDTNVNVNFKEISGTGNFESGEVYYERARTQTEFDIEDNTFYTDEMDKDEALAADGGEEEDYREYSRQSSLISDDMEKEDEEGNAIREIYLKLKWLCEQENRYDDDNGPIDLESATDVDDTGITFKMITDTLDDLIDKRCNNELLKMYNSCYKFFDEKDKKLPLFTCIGKLRDSKNELNTRLLEEMRKTNEMANDMYMHSQDMKNLDKLKVRLNKLEHENDDLRTNCETLENVKAEQMRRINDLEKIIVNIGEARKEEKKVAQRGRPGISPKRSQISQNLTPRKAPFSDPRMAIMQTGYQSTKSPRTQASASTWRPYKK